MGGTDNGGHRVMVMVLGVVRARTEPVGASACTGRGTGRLEHMHLL